MTHPTKRRTFTREQIEGSRRAWELGEFSAEWRPWRHLAAMEAGILFPPSGTRWDSWDDDQPSERALIVRAMRETPQALRAAILSPGVHSWSSVVAIITRGRDRLGDAADERERDWSRSKERRGQPVRMGETLGVVADSIGVTR